MGTPTYTSLANITLGSSAASVTFSSISQAYKDLILVVNGTTAASGTIRPYLNSDTTATNYFYVFMNGDGSSTTSSSGNNANCGPMFTTPSMNLYSFMDYSATDKHKTILLSARNANNNAESRTTRWNNTSAITSIQLNLSSSTFNTGTTFALYGVAA